MAETKSEMLDWDLDDDEFTMEVDNSAADFTGGWFAVEVVGSVCTQYVNERGKSITARVTFKIVDDETFDGTYASTFIRMNDNRIPEARKRKAFMNGVAGEDTGDRPDITYRKVTDTEGNKFVELSGIKGERLGAFIELDGKYLNVKDDMFVSYEEVPGKKAEEEPF